MEFPDMGAGKLYRTVDGGTNWSEVFAAPSYITGLEVSSAEGQDVPVILITTRRRVFKSERGGAPGSWQNITPAPVNRIETVALSPHYADLYAIGTHDQGLWYTLDGGTNWTKADLAGFFEQCVSQECHDKLDPAIATAFNPAIRPVEDISAIEFDPLLDDTLYVGGTQRPRASFGVARVTIEQNRASTSTWQRLPLDGLSHRNVYDLAIDAPGSYLYAGTNDGTFRFQLREPYNAER
jgi:hypothetical protein